MARKIKVSASVLNIRLHPHSPDLYINWIERIFRQRLIVQAHGDRYGIISTLDRSDASRGEITGTITTFVKLERDGPWFNVAQMEMATNDQVSSVSIPQDMYPNAGSFYFLFDVTKHQLYFQSYSKGKNLTPSSALKLFSGFAKDLDVAGSFGEASITVVQRKASLSTMFALRRIQEIEVTILKPNADFFDDDFEEKIEKHMLETKSRQFSVKYKADAGSSIKPDDDIRNISEVALTNGNVQVSGYDEKGHVSLKSEQFPREFHDRFDPEVTNERAAFMMLVRNPHAPD